MPGMARAPPLPDVVGEGLRILFVGINPSLRSAEVGHHFAGRGNPFWRLLHAAGLTPVGLTAEEDGTLPAFGLGITNVCARPTRSAAELSRDELRAGAAALRDKVVALGPEVVALVGVSLLPLVLPGGGEPGPGAKRARLGGARVFVLPNPSGLNAAYPGFQDKLVWFRRLRRFAERPGPARPGRRRASARAGPSSGR
jgi:TDG/mug DNA glycosylase family protein